MDGIIVINKQKGYTSHDVVAIVKKSLKVNKVGHTGTLDPNATGVLPILLGQGTKLSKYLINHDKTYEVVLGLGKKTTTADTEGEVIEEKVVEDARLEEDSIKEVLTSFIGKQEQYPPMYSAIKVKGKKLYEYAREGKHIEVSSRKIEIYEIVLMEVDKEEKTISFKVACSKGTYIRTLCEDVAEKLNTVGYMKELSRTKVGEFQLVDTITIEDLKRISEDENALTKQVITLEELLKNKGELVLTKNSISLFLNGVKLEEKEKDEIYRIYDESGCFIGTGIIQNSYLKRDIIVI